MFINCRHCHALVATDPATDLPPERCPRCAGVLRRAEAVASPAADQDALASAVASAVAAVAAVAAPAEPPAPAATNDPDGPPEPGSGSPSSTEAAGSREVDDTRDPGAAPGGVASPPAAPPLRPVDGVEAAAVPVAPLIARAPVATPSPASAAAMAPTDADAPVAPGGGAATEPKATAAPGFLSGQAPAPTRPRRARRLGRALAIAALALLLGLQVLLADRARLAADARWRPVVAATCDVFGCSLPPWREPSALVLVAREVRPHPDVPGALRVRATFRNDARWPQAWPSLLLTLSDVEGRAVAARVFRADEYGGAATSAPIASGQTADIALDIREPSVATVSFAFDFGQ